MRHRAEPVQHILQNLLRRAVGRVAAGIGITIYPESLIGFLGRSVEVRPILHSGFRSRTVRVWKRNNRSCAVLSIVNTAKKRGVSN